VTIGGILLVLALAAQAAQATAAAHARTLWSERALAFFGQLAEADPERAARARERVLAGLPSGAGAGWYPSLETLAAATRELTGTSAMGPLEARDREQREVQSLADSVDLRVVPGVFAPRETGLGEPTTVAVRCAGPVQGYGPIEARLLWRGPDGRLETARSEPATIEALRAGFPMYLRPPASAEGTWWLVPEIGQRGVTARGVGVRVDCLRVPDAGPPSDGGPAADGGQARGLTEMLALLRSSGARSSVALGPREIARELAGGGGRRPLLLEVAYELPGEGPRWLWGYVPERAPELALVILCADHELPDLPLAGVLGERWCAVAERRGALLLSVNAPPSAATRSMGEVLERAVGAARERGLPDGAPVIAVARGASVARLALAGGNALDGAVLSAVVHSDRPEAVLAPLPRLLIAPGGAAELLQGEVGEFAWVDGSAAPFLNELALPGWVEAWLARR
jgi:hypothetical protein